MLLTVIVPVYNVENYIAKCIESVIYQRIESGIELILVDDGSSIENRIYFNLLKKICLFT